MAKVSTFIIGLVISSLAVAIIALFMGNVAIFYDLEYDNTTFDEYNRLDELALEAQSIQNQTLDIKEKSGILDIIGGYFSDGYKALRLTISSYSTFGKMFNAAIGDLQLGAAGELIRVALITVVIIILVIGVLISAILKKDL